MDDALRKQGKALESQFFAQLDQKLLEKLKQNLEQTSKREVLARVTNVRNMEVLDKLLAQGIDAETFVALTYVPLAAVAWADGNLDPAERQAILKAAENHGTKPGSVGYHLLESWLTQPPGPELFHAWADYVRALRKDAEPSFVAALKAEVLDQAQAIASASGGILGLLQTVSRVEKKKLEELRQAFES